MALSQESVFSVIYHLKHHPHQYWIQDWNLHGAMLFRWIGTSLANFFTFQWVGWLIHLPVVRPDALASLFHEYNFPPTTHLRDANLSAVPGVMTITNGIPTTAETNQFVLGLMNSPALVIAISTTTVFCFRWLCVDEIRWGALLAFFGNFLGNWLVVVAVLFGLDDILAHWYFLTPLTYVGGVLFIWRLVWKWIRAGRRFDAEVIGPFGMDPITWRGLKMGFTGFTLGLTEQTVLFQKLIQPLSPEQLHLLHGFSSGTVRDHMLMHGSYAAGLFVGGFLLGAFILALLVPVADWLCNKGWVTDAKLLLLIVIMTGTSLPYYGLDYVLTRFADLSRDGGWQENTVFRSTFPKEKEARKYTSEIARRDEARPWLEARYLYPERKWLLKVNKISDKPLISLKAALDASKMAGSAVARPLRLQWKAQMDDFDVNAPISAKDAEEGWNLISHHFYQWTEEQVFRQKLQTAMKMEVERARYRMLRIRNMYDKIYVMQNGQLTVENVEIPQNRLIPSPNDIDIPSVTYDFSEAVDEYFDWVLTLTPEAAEKAEKDRKEKQGEQGQEGGKVGSESKSTSSNQVRDAATKAGDQAVTKERKPATPETILARFRDNFRWARESDLLNKANKFKQEDTILAQYYRAAEAELQRGWNYMHARFWKGRAYSHFMFRRLLELEVDSLVSRQPSRNFITDADHNRLEYHQAALAAYHRSLRSYENSLWLSLLNPRGNATEDDYWRSDTWSNWKLGLRAKSLENYVYAQQFKGTQRVIQRLFFLDLPWNPWEGPIFRYDQLLPLEDQDKGDRSNLWHEEIPQSMREKVGAYDPFQSKRVAPMFDPVPFYIGWDPVMRKSVLTTSRMPMGSTRVKLTLPIVSTPSKWDKWDFLGIKRFLEETKLYEYVDFLADEDHEFFVYVRDPDNPDAATEAFKKSKKDRKNKEEEQLHHEPSSVRIHPNYRLIMPGWKFSKLPSEQYRFELQEKLRKMAAEAAESEEEDKRINPNLIKGLKRRLLMENKAEQSVRELRQFQKPLVTERSEPFVDLRSPTTWFKGVPEAITETSDSDDESTDSSEDTSDDESEDESDDD